MPTPRKLRALRNIRAGYGPLVHGVRLKDLQEDGLAKCENGVWQITLLGVQTLIDHDAL